ncbi:Fur family transcriptional regulator, ferric uptake regulator [Ardenticatena maritima]|uniref:Fur family transcriptional regulator, ferric uptake regulator n=1 Tax=Ardenticatena maritima TaxID=872965 RepID=A0A0M9UC15_9CHLR|nr:Fur family transcriptional regulator [Ardenticatena maritima]KPL87187.1 hypothetical protein SE16_11715 [Ardenticatena maritima]GAP62448.1 Fur family transcriptional regulator, ferric uptake regulator [Ardenticatena maritima]
MSMVEQTLQALRDAGLKITASRRVIIETLAEMDRHVTAAELLEAVQRRVPEIGKASVYRTLDVLVRLNVVQACTLGSTTTTYILTAAGHHHHLVCLVCNRTIEIDECILDEATEAIGRKFGFVVEGHLVEVYGKCPDCSQTRSTPTTE